MAQSYHIYLHNVGGGESSSPTKPRKSSKKTTKPKLEEDTDFSGVIKQVGGFIQNPDSLIGAAKSAVVGVATAGVVGAIGYVAYQIGMKVATSAVELQSTITGDISGQIALGNFNNAVGFMFSPISSTVSIMSEKVRINQQNERARLNQQLLGDSVINQNYNRKV